MKKHLLLLCATFVFLVSFRSSDNHVYSYKSSILSIDTLLKVENPLLLASQENPFAGLFSVGEYWQQCRIVNIMHSGLNKKGITFYNHLYHRYLARSGYSYIRQKICLHDYDDPDDSDSLA
ncbi:MAG: hypothetical protein ACQPRH_04075 [Solitalea-like symbiont of Tyrophagus putrescentiae]